ncbi:MAG: hypothetical protein Q8L22_06865, partial [Reyranella sp.]|nr:hypothetical protein [Reyranella sp.]
WSVEQTSLQNERLRRAVGSPLIGQAQAKNMRKYRRERLSDRDLGDTAVAKNAGPAKRFGNLLGAGRFGE